MSKSFQQLIENDITLTNRTDPQQTKARFSTPSPCLAPQEMNINKEKNLAKFVVRTSTVRKDLKNNFDISSVVWVISTPKGYHRVFRVLRI